MYPIVTFSGAEDKNPVCLCKGFSYSSDFHCPARCPAAFAAGSRGLQAPGCGNRSLCACFCGSEAGRLNCNFLFTVYRNFSENSIGEVGRNIVNIAVIGYNEVRRQYCAAAA